MGGWRMRRKEESGAGPNGGGKGNFSSSGIGLGLVSGNSIALVLDFGMGNEDQVLVGRLSKV